MSPLRNCVAVAVMGLLAAACGGGNWPALKAGPPGGAEASPLALAANPTPDVPQVTAQQPALGNLPGQVQYAQAAPPPSPYQAQPAAPPPGLPAASPATTPGSPTGTYVGQKIGQLRGELVRLQGLISSHNAELQQNRAEMIQQSRLYHQIVASVNSRLQVGTTPGNPELIAQWNQAQGELDKIDGAIAKLNRLTNATAGDASMATYLLDSTRAAYSLSGAVDEDHRQLAILEDEINRTVVLIERLLNELSDDLQRQNNYLSGERRNLQLMSVAVKNGELYGPSLYNRPFVQAAPGQMQPLGAVGASAGAPAPQPQPPGNRRPLVVIKFDRPKVEYEQQLYAAVSQALDRKADAVFDLVAVAPAKPGPGAASGVTARRNAEHVMRSLTNMGLPPTRVTLSATNSGQIQVNEVHLYVR